VNHARHLPPAPEDRRCHPAGWRDRVDVLACCSDEARTITDAVRDLEVRVSDRIGEHAPHPTRRKRNGKPRDAEAAPVRPVKRDADRRGEHDARCHHDGTLHLHGGWLIPGAAHSITISGRLDSTRLAARVPST
jgi:hypothetical protein